MNFRISDAGLEQDREAIVSLLRNFNQQKREPSEKVTQHCLICGLHA